MVRTISLFLNIFLLIILFGILYEYFSFKEKNSYVVDGKLVELVIKNNYKYFVKYEKQKLKIIYRDNKKDIKIKDIYVPSEGKFEIISTTSTSPSKEIFSHITKIDDFTYIKVKYSGFTFKPTISYLFPDNEFLIGSRLFYFKRWGGGLSINKNNGIIFFDYKLDSLKFINNSSIGIGYKIFSRKETGVGILVNIYF